LQPFFDFFGFTVATPPRAMAATMRAQAAGNKRQAMLAQQAPRYARAEEKSIQ